MIEDTTNPTRNGAKRAMLRRRPLTCAVVSLGLVAGFSALPAPAGATTVPSPSPTGFPAPTAAPTSLALTPGLPSVPPAPNLPTGGPIGGPLLGQTGVIVDPAAGGAPNVAAPSWVIADATTGKILAARDPHGRARPASTQKVLLALTLLPRLDPNGTYTADHDDEAVEGTRVGMVAGEAYKNDDLWYAVFLRSGNDAAGGLAKEAGGGDLNKAVTLMAAEAQRLQADDTTVVNPSGLDADGQYSSAYDLALWGRAAIQRPDIRKYAGTITWEFPGNTTKTATDKNSHPFQIHTEDRLLGSYPGTIGLKPGYTTLAQNTLIAVAVRNGTTLIATLTDDGRGEITPDAEALLDWGFTHDGSTPPVGVLVDPTGPAYGQTPAPATTAAPADTGKHDSAGGPAIDLTPLTQNWPAVAGSALGVGLLLTVISLRMRVRRRYRRRGALR
ncbi:MAG TPA: D-alanyl-D-alanine carboxypeptidase [Sporichthyaceae bacterium]|jgi:D-alanyl-D-alanine carboxypeptidase (penicillin-binding protein 5/6)|nr:D-alanyl-D-alanine carboxypeptidase [Sporichthyaceae bacterium]